jgi:hypothetical protein
MRALPLLSVARDNRDGSLWRRSGECSRCGACCRSGDPFAGTRGASGVQGACPLYVERDGVGICTDRTDRYYLNGCASWPSLPRHIVDYPGCSYQFERIS